MTALLSLLGYTVGLMLVFIGVSILLGWGI